MANLDTECRKMFEMSAASKAQKSGTVDKKSCKSDAINKIVKETFGAEAARKCDASVFPKHCNKVNKRITIEDYINKLLPDLAKELKLDDNAVKKRLSDKYQEWCVKEGSGSKDTAVVSRLTDTKGYTGSHKERFDDSGKGKGIVGRENRCEHAAKGYVGDYKGEGTHGKKDDKQQVGSKRSSVTDRLTDTKSYTGAHKERFDASGKGRGASGRENRVESKGYVGAYKGEGSYGKK